MAKCKPRKKSTKKTTKKKSSKKVTATKALKFETRFTRSPGPIRKA